MYQLATAYEKPGSLNKTVVATNCFLLSGTMIAKKLMFELLSLIRSGKQNRILSVHTIVGATPICRTNFQRRIERKDLYLRQLQYCKVRYDTVPEY